MTDATAGDLPDRTTHGDPAASAIDRAGEGLVVALSVACRPEPNIGDSTMRFDALRGATYAYIAALRADNVTIEQSVIATKRLIAAAIGTLPASPESRALAEQVVRWGIDAYYDSAPRAD